MVAWSMDESQRVDLRPAVARDYAFAQRLYTETQRPLLAQLDAWNEADVLGRFQRRYAAAAVEIILVNGREAGFLQTTETEAGMNLDQIHLKKAYRSRGIGSRLIRELQSRARAGGKPLSLTVLRNNPAQTLYRRLGFAVDGGNGTKVTMRWADAHASHR